ncbi:arylsulfatase [Olivibacter sp. SDN3]|uniref:arylsulfatase n=1 Tax=Olivibacter sp. SDN3 TaxID=2764720 RepID=UPI00165166D0|nr:arylsulfatase [Olivibacter sp. SDN3]QNL48265.1 arylsulfatase [Olivibacter sp. SDN3]
MKLIPAFAFSLLLTINFFLYAQPAPERPNIIFILADDLGYGDLGIYGQQLIQTPNIDQLGREGIIFTDFYAGAPVCSPSRSVLLTGLHTGHTTIRGNATIEGGIAGKKGKQTVYRANLLDTDYTIGNLLQDAGYTTALVGKWHVDGYDSLATPLHRGFDEFTGWLINQPETYASTYWPGKRYRNGELIAIEENASGSRNYYETHLCTDEAIDFLSRQQNTQQPFFLMVNYNNPHSPLDAPDHAIYKDKDWPEDMKIYAAMTHYLDQSVAKIKNHLIQNGLSENTLIIFCSDNGPRSEGTEQLTAVADFFDSNGDLRGYKRDLYEGGIRVPFIVWAPGITRHPNKNTTPAYFADIMPTLGEIAGASNAYQTDGISIYPAIKGSPQAKKRFLYWEFFERGFEQAVRYGKWKAIKRANKLALYDLEKDIAEQTDLAAKYPEVLEEINSYLANCRTESPFWPTKSIPIN